MTGDSRMTLCDDLNLIWTHGFTSLGIDYNIFDLSHITELNLESKILEMEKLCFIWNSRNLTLIFYNFYSNGINMHRCQYNTVQSFNDYKREAKRTCID